LKGKVQFWAFLQPSRQDVAAYRNYIRRVRQVVQRINSQYGGQGWQPVRLEFGESMRKAMAALRNFDVLVVNPVYDGLNLISKEGALVNRADGVIVLSENAGAHEELNPHVLSINPFDIMATANAMHQAIVMSAEEKKKRNESAREVVRTNDITRWITRQVQDIRDLAATPGLRAG
jgi:trehalose 6-phosphate synthase